MKRDTNSQAFFALLKAGLWENEVRLSQYKDINFSAIYKLAEEQSVVGLVAAGLEHVTDVKVPQNIALEFVGVALRLEQRNKAMNFFIEDFFAQLRSRNLYALLVKGQGIAQCYERSLWRSAGDIDLLLDAEDYEKAKHWLLTVGKTCEDENDYKSHIEFIIGTWDVELHGSLRSELGRRIDRVVDEVQDDVFFGGSVRSWQNGKTTIFLPAPDNDVIFVFAHILQHFFRGGIGLRQICDWCRLLWTYREKIDQRLLEMRIRKMGVMTEWRAFALVAIKWLGMPREAMPLYSDSARCERKAERIIDYILEVGNFGYNRDMEYKRTSSFFRRMMISLGRRTHDYMAQAMVFPVDASVVYCGVWKTGMKVVGKRLWR